MGYIGESHIEAIRRIGLCQLCAVADTNYELAKQKEETEKLLEEKMERWMYLEDKAARIENGEMVEI